MMALLYAVQGAWWPLMAVHLKDQGITGPRRGLIFGCQALGTVIVSLGLGRMVDRVWPAQVVMAIIFGIGSLALAVVASGVLTSSGSLFVLFFLYWLATAPCYSLANALAFRNLERPGEQFGHVRLWGTAGWMVIGWVVSATMVWSGSIKGGHGAFEAFWVATVVSLIFAVYCLTLPHTPPLASKAESATTRDALLGLLKQPGMPVYLVTSFGVFLTTPFVFQVMPTYLESKGLPRSWTATVMTIGQWPEIGALALLPNLLRRRGYKFTIGLGLVAWFLRFASLATDPPLVVAVAGTLLHGVGIACITIGGQVYVDQCAPPEYRATAQALNMSITSGLGALIGSLLAGASIGGNGGESSSVFLVPCLIQTGLIIFFGLAFCPSSTRSDRGQRQNAKPRVREGARSIPSVRGVLVMESADG
jgi:MFS family permease